jgi:hypothetical protein
MAFDDERCGQVLGKAGLDDVELDGMMLADELTALHTPGAAGCNPKWKLNWNSQRVSSIISIP